MMFVVLGDGKPVKMMVAGVHGREAATTESYLWHALEMDLDEGLLVLATITKGSKYISTLNPRYLKLKAGKKLVSLIKKFKPQIYLELHSYSASNYWRLVDPLRKIRKGVPPLIDIGDGVLIGAVSPYIRRLFSLEDFCFVVETPKGQRDNERTIEFIELVLSCRDRFEITRKLREKFPQQIKIAEEYYEEYLRELSHKTLRNSWGRNLLD